MDCTNYGKLGTDVLGAQRMNHNDDLVILGDFSSSAQSKINYLTNSLSEIFQYL